MSVIKFSPPLSDQNTQTSDCIGHFFEKSSIYTLFRFFEMKNETENR